VQKPTFFATNQVEVSGRFITKKDVWLNVLFLIFPVVVVIM